MKKYKEFIREGLTDKMAPKTKEDIDEIKRQYIGQLYISVDDVYSLPIVILEDIRYDKSEDKFFVLYDPIAGYSKWGSASLDWFLEQFEKVTKEDAVDIMKKNIGLFKLYIDRINKLEE
jgi:hypothetical protein